MTEEDKRDWKFGCWCVICGFSIFGALNSMPFSNAEKYRIAKQECEKSLPRDQQCVVVAVPQEKK